MHRGRRRQADGLADLADRRRIAAVAHRLVDHLEDLALAVGERLVGHRCFSPRLVGSVEGVNRTYVWRTVPGDPGRANICSEGLDAERRSWFSRSPSEHSFVSVASGERSDVDLTGSPRSLSHPLRKMHPWLPSLIPHRTLDRSSSGRRSGSCETCLDTPTPCTGAGDSAPSPSCCRRRARGRRHRARAVERATADASVAVRAGTAVPGPRRSRRVRCGRASRRRGSVYVVQPGDTLWSIARELDPTGDVRADVDRLADLNGTAALAGRPTASADRRRQARDVVRRSSLARRAVSDLLERRRQGRRLAGLRRRRRDPPPARVPRVRPPVHDLRAARRGAARRGEALRRPRAVRPDEDRRRPARRGEVAAAARRRARGDRRQRSRSSSSAPGEVSTERIGLLVLDRLRDARPGRLRALRQRLQGVRRRRRLRARAHAAHEGDRAEAALTRAART